MRVQSQLVVFFTNFNQWLNFVNVISWLWLWISQISLITSVKINWFNSENYFSKWFDQWKLTDLKIENFLFISESVKMQITDSISEDLTDSDLESSLLGMFYFPHVCKANCGTTLNEIESCELLAILYSEKCMRK